MLQFEELRLELSGYEDKLTDLAEALGLSKMVEEVKQMEEESAKDGFWDDIQRSQKITQHMASLKNKIKAYEDLKGSFEDTLTLNNAYTVEVSGEGYRTARYTVTMTDDKQLNFWNNVMDEAQVVEVGKDSSIAKVTFLAGDIVKDNNINIYDLSAVVSYFGSVSTTENGYAKYDLNRDGVIDSKDVAYVLVSWGE